MKYRARVVRLEEYRRKRLPSRHFLPVVCYPWELEEDDQDRWLREDVTCVCGATSCPNLQIAALLPEKAPSIEAWEAMVQRYNKGER